MSNQDTTEVIIAEKNTTMFELVDVHGRITLDNVYLNGLHALRRLYIRNLSNQPISIKMRSNLRNQIAFQLENENISNLAEFSATTNTVDWSQEEHPFNQLFNYINHIDQIELEPNQTRSFILGFLPEDTNDYNIMDDEDTDTFNIFNVTGSIFFFGYYLDTLSSSSEDSKDVLSTSTLADYQVSVKFRASVCQSALWTDITQTGLNFDDCVIGETYYKDFTIHNRSEIDLFWLLNTADLVAYSNYSLQFVDPITGNPIHNLPNSIPSYAAKQIRVIFMPKEVGEFNYDLQLENANDARNSVQTKVHASVRSVLRKETLIVTSGQVVDFGDCISGTWAVQQIVLNNISESPLEVKFIPEGAEVIFDIKQDTAADEGHPAEPSSTTTATPPTATPTAKFIKRKFSSQRTNTPTTITSVSTTPQIGYSEASGQNSEFSSRSTSPTPSRTATDPDSAFSPTTESPPTGSRLYFPSQPTIPEDSDSDYGTVGDTNAMNTETSSLSDGVSITASSITIAAANANATQTSGGTNENYTRIEDFVLKPGTERIIQVSYRPQKDASINDFNAGQLIRRNFRFLLEYGTFRSAESKQRKVVQCRARTCTSFVEVIPKVVNFGDTDVGTLKSLPIRIFNRSDIMARVELQFASKVLNCLRGEITIQPKNYVELKLDLYPRKVNPDYRKQITLVNYLNKDNDQIIEVHSTNIDKNRVTFHSLYYRILTATGANFLDFGSIALDSPAIRTFTIENIRDKPLTLEVTTSLPDDIIIYTRNKTKTSEDSSLTTNITTSATSKLLNSITPESIEKEEKRAKLEATEFKTESSHTSIPSGKNIPNVSAHRKRSKLLLESVNSRRISPEPTHKPTAELEIAEQRRISDATKKDPLVARRIRAYIQQMKMDRAQSTIAYLDLALPPSKHKRKRMVKIDPNIPLLKNTRHAHHQVTTNHSSAAHTNLATAVLKKSVTANSKLEVAVNGLKDIGRHDSFGTRSAKTKRSLGITAARYKSRKNLDWSDIAGKSRVPFEDLISVLEQGSKATPPLFPKQSAEEQYVRYQLAWRRELNRLIEKKVLIPTSIIRVDPKEEEEVVVIMIPSSTTKPHIQSTPKKQDARIFLRLMEFDRDIEQTEFENLLDLDNTDIPVREVILRSQLCRSVMDLGQKNINFGLVERNERHTKTIVLHNRSETPLLYAIRKSGSIASGDIDLDAGRYGVVRAYGKREVEFVFEPTLSGPFMEKLIVENIRDRTNDQVLLLKAQVRKPSTFLIKSLEMSFSHCLVDCICPRSETIVLTNTNKQPRMFEVRVDPNEVNFGHFYGEFDFDVKDDDTNTLSKEAEEEIENLEQKLKIAKRKAQPDKVEKYLRKLAKLKNLDQGTTKPSDEANALATPPNSTSSISSVSLNTTKEGNIIFKKTAESVVFPLDAHATKTVHVIFKPVQRPLQLSDTPPPKENPMFIKGRILVHEYKNTDVCKSIMYTANVFADEASYTDALATTKKDIDKGNLKTENTSASITSGHSTTHAHSPTELILTETATAGEETPIANEDYLKLERDFFDGGRIEINQRTLFYVRMTNESDIPIDFEFISAPNDSFQFEVIKDEEGMVIQPRETRKISYALTPSKVGKQTYTFSIKNRCTDTLQSFTIQCLVHCATYLDFPSLDGEANGVLDLGFSYVDPGSKYSQVTPLLVENKSGQDIYITCQSNLSHQVLIFMDEAGERGLVEMMPLKRGGMTTVWVAVQPNLLTGYLGNNSADECRELIGGIKFFVHEKDEKDDNEILLMLTQTVKFISIIGQSHLEISDKVINLGHTDLLNKDFYGAFTIRNKSGQLPLDYEVECITRNIELDRRGGTLNGWLGNKIRGDAGLCNHIKAKSDKDSHHVNPEASSSRRCSYDDMAAVATSSFTQITFRVYAYQHGFLSEKLIVTNKRNSQEVFEINVRLFVDCKKLDAWSLPSKKLLQSALPTNHTSCMADDQTEHLEADPLPMIKWESIYVCPFLEQDKVPTLQLLNLSEQDATRHYVRELDIANTSGQPMQLVVLSDIDIAASWTVDADKVKTVAVIHKNPAFVQRSSQFALQPGQRVRVRLHSPSADKLDEEGHSLALQGKSGSLKGMMILYDARQDLELLALELEALFCVSRTELSVECINLGKIGHSTSYKPARFEFQIHNLSDVPATYDIQGPRFVKFTPLDKNGVALKQKTFYIPSRKTQRVEGLLLPKEMPDQSSGLHHMEVDIVNLRNNSNMMHLQLKALMTVFELRFERLSSNGELLLPTLHHPIALPNTTCDNWFVIHNKTEEDLRFEIGADIVPELRDHVYLDVLSRYTNSPLKGDIAIGPLGSIEVRVRASPNESSRLPRNRPEFTDPAGIIMAKLWVTTRPIEDGYDHEDGRCKETILVRCHLEEKATFILSEQRLDFKLVTYYQENDGGEDLTDSACMPESLPFTIINHATKVPLRFKVTVEGPAEFPAHEIVQVTGLDEEGKGIVNPGDQLTLSVAISNPKESMPGQLKIHVDDLDALGDSRQTVSMYVTEIVWDL
ncbi:hypothetical protein G6F57_004485 [Rhizopus arrhizus]|nr:hypothetical protein G6F30_007077 [Rhizopus arrhizus]KAG1425300.1 hypothetical protein G6F58_001983 [Rhizopus delemar]KAG0982767.1 hypothetical protein G6F29_006049 [Rhizopus arrhizus]KAG0993413.1 hypothetical protein G6F28_006716 [Rhizopus arrhizus]KAG1007294.1 hypothetical protein G6F27_007515 [Rhizopus arrhizus]